MLMPGEVPMCALLRRPGQGRFGCVLAEGVLERRCWVMVLQELVLFWWLRSWGRPAERPSWPAWVCSVMGGDVLSSSLALAQRSQCDGRKCSFCSMKVSIFLFFFVTASFFGKKTVPPGLDICCYLKEDDHHQTIPPETKVYKALYFPNL